MKCPTCEHRVHPEAPKHHDPELCARVAKLEEMVKDSPSAVIEEITRRQRRRGRQV